jgi:phenylalanyl-tRNA synthetase beta chain
MKVTCNWLKQYVDFDWTAEELAERLTMLGVEVEGMESSGGMFEGIVVGEVITRKQHPNADRLTLCKVNDGNGERQIVCGATNFEAGDKVALALPGTSMPVEDGEKPFILKEGKIRGELSQGMMCSGHELKLNDEHEGILILPGDAQIGQSFAEHLGQTESDVVYDLEITPNRPDLNGVIGLAREVAALTGNPMKIPQVPKVSSGNKAADLIDVRIEDTSLCPRYNARVIEGVRIGQSPEWLTSILEKVGIRSINNIVDVTNYVMMETGQPLHAFDLHLLAKANGKPTVVVRRARDGEKFTTLDGQEHKLTSDNLLIADPEKGIALAGVMGGFNTEIKESTRDVLLETAYFCPKNIRATAKSTGLHTDASYRFERGADVGVVEWASQRAAQLIAEVSGGTVAKGDVDAFPKPPEPCEITLRHHRTDELLGITVVPKQSVTYLQGLQLELSAQDDLSATFIIPTWRVDLKREIDLIEEVCRLHGIEQISATSPRGCIGENEFDSSHDDLAEVRQILTGMGLDEAQGQTLISDTSAQLSVDEFLGLEHPLSSDMNVLRPSLLPGLLDSLRNNFIRQNFDVALFEIGRVFAVGPKEYRKLGIAITGCRQMAFWKSEDATLDASDLKGVVEELLERIGAFGINYERRETGTSLFLESAELKMGKNMIGQMGQLLPVLGRKYESRDAIFLAELDLDILLERRTTNKSFKSLPKFPASERDVAMLVPESVTHAEVLLVVKKAKAANLVDTKLFDVFRGQNVPEGQKSLAYSFTYRSAEKTLTDEEVNSAHEPLVVALKEQLGATIRDT